MTTPTYGDYDVTEVDGFETLQSRIEDAGTSVEKWSHILTDYISFGNNKIAKHVAIFNMNSATDCPNADSDNCQVPWDSCYAHKAENIYKTPLDYRRRQEYVWDSISPELFAKAFLKLVERKRNDVSTIRFSESGDFRHQGDIARVNEVARIVGKEGIDVYTYSASDYLDWSDAEHFTVNQSNDFSDYGDRLYSAVDTVEDIPEGAVQCAYEASDIKCGDCKLCINPEGPDVYITLTT